jgi:hypothetical protein
MKELLTKRFWLGVKKIYDDALQGPPPEEQATQPPPEEAVSPPPTPEETAPPPEPSHEQL